MNEYDIGSLSTQKHIIAITYIPTLSVNIYNSYNNAKLIEANKSNNKYIDKHLKH